MKKQILVAVTLCFLLFQTAWSQVNLTLNPNSVVSQADRSLYGINFQRALNNSVATNTSFKARVNELNPSMVRYHAYEQISNGHGNSWVNYSTQSWDVSKIDAVLDNSPVSGDNIVITITGWPTWMDTNNDGRLDGDKSLMYFNFCADLVDIVNNQLGHNVKYWEPFNEKDGGTYSGSSDMVLLADIFKGCHAAMKAEDSAIKMVGGAWRQPWDADIDAFLSNLGSQYLDVWSHHEYGGSGETNVQTLYNRTNLHYGISHMRTKLDQAGYTGVPVWQDEWNIYWSYNENGYQNMTNNVGAVYDALCYKRIAEQGIAGAIFSWNAADGRYGKIKSDFSGLNPGGHVFDLLSEYGHGDVLSITSGNDTQIEGFSVKNAGNNTQMIAIMNRHSSSVNVNFSAGGWTPTSDVVTKHVISSSGYSTSTVSWANDVLGSVATAASSVTIFVSTASGGGADQSGAPIGSTIALKANANNLYVEAVSGSGNQLKAQASNTSSTTTQFEVVDAGSGLIGLKCISGNKYVAAENYGNSPLVADRNSIGGWEKFEWSNNSDGTISLKSTVNSKYVTAESGGNDFLIANRTAIGGWEKFTVETIGGGGTDDAISVSGPNTVEPGGTFDVTVEYEASTNRNISVYLFNTSVWNTHGSATVSVPAGSGSVTLSVTIASPAVGTDYQWTAKIEEQGTNAALDEVTTWCQVVSNIPNDDAVSVSAINAVQAGGTYDVTVNYDATQSRKVSVYLFNTTVWNIHGSASTTVPAGPGTVVLSVTVATPAVGTDYQWTAKVEDLSTSAAFDEVSQWCQVIAGSGGGGGGSGSTYYFYSETGSDFISDGGSTGNYAMNPSTQTSGAPEGSQYLRIAPSANYASYWYAFSAGQDKSAWSGGTLTFDVKTTADFDVTLEQGNGTKKTVSLGSYISKSGSWEKASIPLSAFGLDLAQFKALVFYRLWNASITLDLDNIRVTGVSGAREAEPSQLSSKIEVYPNPTTNHLFIRNQEDQLLQVALYDLSGHQLSTLQSSEKSIRLNLQGINTGVYLLQVTGDGIQKTHRIAIKK